MDFEDRMDVYEDWVAVEAEVVVHEDDECCMATDYVVLGASSDF